MIRQALDFLAFGLMIIAAGAATLTAGPASAAPVSYTATTTLTTLKRGNVTFAIDQINDGQTSATLQSGFGAEESTGDILFTFAGPTDLSQFTLWNNIVVDSWGGIVDFSLEFLDSNNASLGQSNHVAVSNQVAPLQIALSQKGVRAVRLHVSSSKSRIEIREVRFEGQRSKPGSFTTACSAVGALGFPLATTTVTRSSNPLHRGAIVIPASYPVGPLRPYNDAQDNRVFIDSFRLIPTTLRHVCQIVIRVRGSTPGYVGADDYVRVFLPKQGGVILNDGTGWNTAKGSVLQPGMTLTSFLADWTYDLTINSSIAAMQQPLADALATGPNFLDVVVYDDSLVKDISVTYTLY